MVKFIKLNLVFMGIFFSSSLWAFDCAFIQDVKNLGDDTAVRLCGTITRNLKGEYFELKDETGTLAVEIDSDMMPFDGTFIGKKVEIMGEIDKDMIPDFGEYRFSVDVKKMRVEGMSEILEDK